MIDGACQFTENMYDWTREKIKDYITANSSNDFLYIKYTWRQLGLSEEWYEKQCRDLMNDWLIIRREVDLQWTKSSDNSVFKEDELDLISSLLKPSIGNHTVEVSRVIPETNEIRMIPYNFVLYKPIIKDKVYFIGVDTAGGMDKDFSTIVLTDPDDNFRPVAIFKNNKINVRQFADLLVCLIKQHVPNSILFIENNNYGKGVIDICLDYISKSIYFEYKVQDKDKTKPNPSQVTEAISYGINTSTGTRELMMDVLREIVSDAASDVIATEIYEDIKGLIYNSRGKIEHDRGMHDDVLFGYLMVQYAVRYGNNIAKFMRNRKHIKANTNAVTAITGSPEERARLNDPAYNKGMDVDFQDILRLMSQGETLDSIKQDLINRSTKQKGKRPGSEINQNTLALLRAKR